MIILHAEYSDQYLAKYQYFYLFIALNTYITRQIVHDTRSINCLQVDVLNTFTKQLNDIQQ